MALSEVTLNSETVLLVPVSRLCLDQLMEHGKMADGRYQADSYLINSLGLVNFRFQQLLNSILYNFPSFLHTTGESSKRLFKLHLHLRRDGRVGLTNTLCLPADSIQRAAKSPSLIGTQRFATQRQKLPSVLIFNCCAGWINQNNQPWSPISWHAMYVRTAVERLQLIASCLCNVHALQHGPDASVIFAPEIICN